MFQIFIEFNHMFCRDGVAAVTSVLVLQPGPGRLEVGTMTILVFFEDLRAHDNDAVHDDEKFQCR